MRDLTRQIKLEMKNRNMDVVGKSQQNTGTVYWHSWDECRKIFSDSSDKLTCSQALSQINKL